MIETALGVALGITLFMLGMFVLSGILAGIVGFAYKVSQGATRVNWPWFWLVAWSAVLGWLLWPRLI